MRQEDFENNRKDYLFKNKKVSVVKSHNFVLPVWAEYCATTQKEYRLITFDYHMDTRPIFSQYACRKCNYDMAKVDSYEEQKKVFNKYVKDKYNVNKIEEMTKLYVFHDEHISVGYDMGYISDLFCICKDNQDYSEGYKNYLVLDACVKHDDIIRFCNMAKEKQYILDIDLDFFNCEEDFQKYEVVIADLIKNTDIITIATENEYFDFLNTSSRWTNELALQSVLDLIKENI
jgi:hypothetical protein